MIENSFAWFDPSIESYFLIVSSLILLRSLRVYVLKQLFFLISVNRGFRNIYLFYFQRIIVIKLVHIIMVCFPSLKQAPRFWVFSTNEKAAGKNGIL